MSNEAKAASAVRPLRGGRIVIPAAFRKELGIEENAMLRVPLCDGELRMTPVRMGEPDEGSPWLRELYEYFAPVREEILRRGISEEEVNADIDAAIAAVRAERRAQRG